MTIMKRELCGEKKTLTETPTNKSQISKSINQKSNHGKEFNLGKDSPHRHHRAYRHRHHFWSDLMHGRVR
jgi:hypothetical protein